MFRQVELVNSYSVVVENDPDTKKTKLGVENWQLIFSSKQEVVDHINMLQQALHFWEYD